MKPAALSASAHTPSMASATAFGRTIRPGVMLCLLVTLAAIGLTSIERDVIGHVWLEPLVLAILLGAAIRTAWTPDTRFKAGIDFSAKTLLEVAVVLLGASVSAATLSSLGVGFVLGIFALVALAIVVGFGVGRALGLNPRMALLVACGNAICGNSAIAAVAPVIDADGKEVAASIAFTAVLGVIVVLTLPLLGGLIHLNGLQYGALAGLTVYAVPQVLAAAAPFGAVATQTGTVVKLVRVLMLGPVILALSLIFRERAPGAAENGLVEGAEDEPALSQVQVGSDRLAVLVTPDHPWATRRRLEAKDLAGQPWVLREVGSGTRSTLETAVRDMGVDPATLSVSMTLPSNEAVLAAAEAGAGATALSESVAYASVAAGRLVTAPFTLPERPFRLLRHRERYRSRAGDVFVEAMG